MTNKNIPQLPCTVVQDLLPLYHDGLVSEGTKEAVDYHLEGCENCRNEYELIRTELPVEKKQSTGQRFAGMMKKLRIKRILILVLTAVLSCSLLAGGFWGLTQVPLRQLEDGNISIVRIHPYEEKGSQRVFILCLVPAWNSPASHRMYLEETDKTGVWELKYDFKVAIVSGRFTEEDSWEFTWDIEIPEEAGAVRSILFEGNEIWSAKDAEAAPDYVYAYRDYEQFQSFYDGMTLDVDKNFIGFDSYENQYYIYWDLDGNLLYEGDGTDADKVIDFDVPLDLADYPPVIE